MKLPKKARKYLPIKIHSVELGIGYWWGDRFYFPQGWRIPIITPSWFHLRSCQTLSGKAIEHGKSKSWERFEEIVTR